MTSTSPAEPAPSGVLSRMRLGSGHVTGAWVVQIIQFCVLLAGAGALSVWLGQDANWDLQNYHLYDAFAFLHNGYAADPGATAQWYLNPLLDIPYYLLSRSFATSPRVVAFTQGMFTGVVWFILWKIVKLLPSTGDSKLWRPLRVLVWAAACSGTMLISETGTTFGDVQITILVVISFYCALRYVSGGASIAYLVLAYLLLGAATGLKLTAGMYLIGLLTATLVTVRKPRILLILISAAGAGLLLTDGWWALFLQLHYSSPIFPFFNNVFHSPWWPDISGADKRFFPKTWMQWLIYPAFWVEINKSRVTEVPFADGRMLLGVLSSLVLAVALTRVAVLKPYKKSCRTQLLSHSVKLPPFAIVFFLTSYVVWLVTFSIYRYAMPLECLSPLIFFMLVGYACSRFGARRLIAILLSGCALIAMMAWTRYPNWMRVSYGRRVFSITNVPDLRGGTILAASGNPPIGYLFPQLTGASHFITVSPGFRGTMLYRSQSRVVDRSNRIYVIEQKGATPYLSGLLGSYWGLVKIASSCVEIHPNMGGPFTVCRYKRR